MIKILSAIISFLLLISLTSLLSAAPVPVSAISAHYVNQSSGGGDYIDDHGRSIKFAQGTDNDLLVDSITVNGNLLRAHEFADSIKVHRVENNQCISSTNCNKNIGGISGEKLFFQYPFTGSPYDHDLKPARAYSIEEIYLSHSINVAVDNLLSNVDNNIERLDIIFSGGIDAPSLLGLRKQVGFMISERWGNNPHQIAAIKSLDSQNNPTDFYALSKANISHYGNTLFTISHSDGSITGPAIFAPPSHRYKNNDSPVNGGIAGSRTQPLNGAPQYFLSTTQPVRSTFHSLEQLGVAAGEKVYGISVFGIDVTSAMDLVSLTDVPLNTDHVINDSADIFGAIATFFKVGDQARVGIAKALSQKKEVEAGIFDIELTFTVENLSGITAKNIQVIDKLNEAFAGANSVEIIGTPDLGGFTQPSQPYNGYTQVNLLSGSDSLAGGEKKTIKLRLRVDIGASTGIYENSALVTTSTTPGGDLLSTDLSDDGYEPDPNGDGYPDGVGEDDSTGISLGVAEGAVTIDKSVGKTIVVVGDMIPYSLMLTNNTEKDIASVEVQDTPSQGLIFVEDSAVLLRPGADAQFGTSDDIQQPLKPRGTNTKIFGPFVLESHARAQIKYLLRVSPGIAPGTYNNVAVPYRSSDPIGPQSSVSVDVIKDSDIDQASALGVVFFDRNEDGYQNDVTASDIQLKIFGVEHLLDISRAQFLTTPEQTVKGDFEKGFVISSIVGRRNESETALQGSVQLRIPLKANVIADQLMVGRVIVESAEGTLLEGDLLGAERMINRHGQVENGINAQRLDFFSKVEVGENAHELVITVLNDAIDEVGIGGVRLGTVEGLLIETDRFGRYHLADISFADKPRGSQFIIKLDPKTLPEGSTFTTENPRVLRITSSLLNRINFGVKLPDEGVTVAEVTSIIPEHTIIEEQLKEDRKAVTLDSGIPNVRFDSGVSKIGEKTATDIKALVDSIGEKENVRIQATGHTDSVPLGSTLAKKLKDNQGLSEARAEAVARAVKANKQLSGIKVVSEGKSYREPVASNATDKGRALNRRVEVQVVYDEVTKKWVKVPVQVAEATKVEIKPLINGGSLWATEDPSIIDPRLDIEVDNIVKLDENSVLKNFLSFSTYTNYRDFITSWELILYPPSDQNLTQGLVMAGGTVLKRAEPIKVFDLDRLGALNIGDSIAYKLRVYNDEGHWDETAIKQIRVLNDDWSDGDIQFQSERLIGQSSLRVQSIPIRGSRIRIVGAGVSDEYNLSLNGEVLKADNEGSLITEQHLPMGEHQLQLTYKDDRGATWERDLNVEVNGDYLFMVGLANLTIGGNTTSGAVELLEGSEDFGDDFVNARGAFYLKGKIKGKYLVTAQLDTQEGELKQWDEQLKRKNNMQLFRMLDPDRYYPVYGDDSTIYSDVDSQGAFYVRVDWDKSRALWGNFNTDITANEFAHYNRSLYGAQLVHRSIDRTNTGEHKTMLTGFASEAQSAAAHNEFVATGGSLYYLQKTDVITGSEKIWIEIREEDTRQVVERYPLRAGVDYDIDYFQGRIILTQPLSQIARRKDPSIIQDGPLQGDDVILLADYEYIPTNLSLDNTVAGIRGKAWMSDNIGVGATLIEEEREGENYNLKGVDLTVKPTKGMYIKGEFARSESNQATSRFTSTDGGLTFDKALNHDLEGREGDAVGIEAGLDFSELTGREQQGGLKLWHKARDEGFSSSRDDHSQETVDQGVALNWLVNKNIALALKSKRFEQVGVDEKVSHRAQLDAKMTERLSLGVELQRSNHAFEVGADQDALLLGGQLAYAYKQGSSVYVKAQTVLDNTKAYEDNEQITVGLSSKVSQRLTLGGELISGDRGDGVVLSGAYSVNKKTSVEVAAGFGDGIDSQVTANYLLDNGLNLYGSFARSNADSTEQKSIYTLGQRVKMSNATDVYAENQLTDVKDQTGLTHVFGVDYGLNEYLTLMFSLQQSTLETDGADDISRKAGTVGFRYQQSRIHFSSKLEYRKDESEIDLTQWLTSNSFEFKQSKDYRWLGRLNYSISRDDNADVDHAKFTETSIGFAYRPALNDRFNGLTRLTYLYDLPAPEQDTLKTEERSWVLATEGAYVLTPRWELGGKLAAKKGEVRQQRLSGLWFDSEIHFYAARVRYHLISDWDALAEYRWLESVEDESVSSGGLLAIYKHIGDHIKLGGGYNFTDFNDDLTDLDYDNKGWFVDITAKY